MAERQQQSRVSFDNRYLTFKHAYKACKHPIQHTAISSLRQLMQLLAKQKKRTNCNVQQAMWHAKFWLNASRSIRPMLLELAALGPWKPARITSASCTMQ